MVILIGHIYIFSFIGSQLVTCNCVIFSHYMSLQRGHIIGSYLSVSPQIILMFLDLLVYSM